MTSLKLGDKRGQEIARYARVHNITTRARAEREVQQKIMARDPSGVRRLACRNRHENIGLSIKKVMLQTLTCTGFTSRVLQNYHGFTGNPPPFSRRRLRPSLINMQSHTTYIYKMNSSAMIIPTLPPIPSFSETSQAGTHVVSPDTALPLDTLTVCVKHLTTIPNMIPNPRHHSTEKQIGSHRCSQYLIHDEIMTSEENLEHLHAWWPRHATHLEMPPKMHPSLGALLGRSCLLCIMLFSS